MKPRWWLLSLAAALVVLLEAAGPALAARSDAKAIWGPVTWNGQAQFPAYRALGAGIYEMTLDWSAIAPTRPTNPRNPRDRAYHWPAAVDQGVALANQYGMRVMLLGTQVPRWANGGHSQVYVPRRAADMADFFRAAASRYPKVRLWMVWDEATRPHNFAPLVAAPWRARRLTAAQAVAPHRYAELLDTVYGALKTLDTRNLIIGGATYTTGALTTAQWVENLRLPNGRPPRMDLYSHNPFSWRAPDLSDPPSPQGEVDFSDLARLYALVNRQLARPGQHIRLFLSEWMIPTATDSELNVYVTRAVQAQWITDAWRIVRHHSFIYALGWIHFHDDGPSFDGKRSGSQSGLRDWHDQPKPGYFAFRDG